MGKLMFVGVLFPLLVLSIPLKISDLKTNNLANLLFDLYELRDDIRAQTIRPDLTDTYIEQLINDTHTKIKATGNDFHAKPDPGLISRAKDYYEFLKLVTKDFPPATRIADLKIADSLAESYLISLGDLPENEDNTNTPIEDFDPHTENLISDEDGYADIDSNGYDTPQDDSSYLVVSDPGFKWTPRHNKRARSNIDQSNDRSSVVLYRNFDDDSEEEKIGPPLYDLGQNLLVRFEEEADQASSEGLRSPLWYGGGQVMDFDVDGDEDDIDFAAYAAGV
ncbi:hypothetical protein TWF694_005394 [Orbilia ellipsospora]|uniref:Uncharacterized protein n=1 Tax=Orbilia ellipsospora TaxID=2528407 RepID=A0AAV9WZ16_9PEZI